MFAQSKRTRAEAWLVAAEAMQKTHARMYNVVLEIEQPGLATNASRAVEAKVDAFLHNSRYSPRIRWPKRSFLPSNTGGVASKPSTAIRRRSIRLSAPHLKTIGAHMRCA